jgi:hypothetical protein
VIDEPASEGLIFILQLFGHRENFSVGENGNAFKTAVARRFGKSARCCDWLCR